MTDPAYVPGEPIYYCNILPTDIKKLYVVPISDAHYGYPLFSKKHFLATLEKLALPDHYAILNGDLCESTIRTSKGDIFRQAGTPQDQRDQMIEWLYPYRSKILGMDTGNHENRIWNEAGMDISADIAKELKIPYRPEGLILKTSFGRGNERNPERPYTYFLYMTHGYGGARTISAKAVKVERLAGYIHADVYFMAHDHVANAAPVNYLVPDPRTHIDQKTGFRIGHVRAIRKLLVKTNAYVKWGGYAEMGGYSPNDLFTPIVQFHGEGKPEVHVLI